MRRGGKRQLRHDVIKVREDTGGGNEDKVWKEKGN